MSNCRETLERLRRQIPLTRQQWAADAVPVVSVCCYTYNQRHLLRDALEGFLAQETDFPVEIVVQDDASTDGTDELIRRYAANHPALFRPVFHAENASLRGISPMLSCLGHCQGEFVAICEGDDYWNYPRKLQLQVEFLRANPDCVGCIHDAKVVDAEAKVLMESCINRKAGRYTRDDCIGWLLGGYPTCSLVFRREALRDIPQYLVNIPRDTTLDIAITKYGDLGVLDANMSVYRKHAGATWSGDRPLGRHLRNEDMFVELLLDDELRNKYGDRLREHLRASRRKILLEAGRAESMEQSLSWKVTKPLRLLRRLFDQNDRGKG